MLSRIMDDRALPNPTIGIITALEIEYVAVKVLLPDAQEKYPQGVRGIRRYLSAIVPAANGGVHSVAAVLLSDMGNDNAATRAAALLQLFSSIESIIMVGIAGGVPNPDKVEDHVRLGDVVVSDRGGVVQYDFDKETVTETIVRHPPRPPSPLLLEGVRHLKAGSLQGNRPWERFIQEARRGFKPRVNRPKDETDVLASTADPTVNVNHPKDRERRKGQPRIFTGSIASANKLLKNPVKRDALRDRFGVKAVEMEGSGIANASWDMEAGYLVVRGICDYCDSNKGDWWQKYAAIVAAAYVRALLEAIPARNDGGSINGIDGLKDAQEDAKKMGVGAKKVRSANLRRDEEPTSLTSTTTVPVCRSQRHEISEALLHELSTRADRSETDAISTNGSFQASVLPTGRDVLVRHTGDNHLHWLLGGHAGEITSAAFSPDGRILATGSEDRTARLWRMSDGLPERILQGHGQKINHLAFSPDGLALATASNDKTVRLWPLICGEDPQTLDHSGRVHGVAFVSDRSPNRWIVATASSDGVRLWPATKNAQPYMLGDKTNCVALASCERVLAAAFADGTVRWCRIGYDAWHNLEEPVERIKSLAFSPDGRLLAAASDTRTVIVWRVVEGRAMKPLKLEHAGRVHGVTFASARSSNQWVVATSSSEGVCLWRIPKSNRPAQRVRLLSQPPNGSSDHVIVFSPTEHNLVTASKTVHIWEWTTREGKGEWNAHWGESLRIFGTPRGHEDDVTNIAFSPDNAQLLATGSTDGSLRMWRLWEAARGNPPRVLPSHGKRINSITFSPRGDLLATASDDRTVRVWRVEDGGSWTTLPHLSAVMRVLFSPGGEALASTTADHAIYLWLRKEKDWSMVPALGAPPSAIASIAFSSAGDILAALYSNRMVGAWNVLSGNCVGLYPA